MNKTYYEKLTDYDAEKKEYDIKKKERENHNPEDPYGDEDPLVEPEKP